METTRFPLTAILANRDSTVTKDGLLVNCYEEKTPIGDMVVKRPGLEFYTNYGLGCAQGAISFNGQMLIVMRDQYGVVTPAAADGSLWSILTPQPDPASSGASLANGRAGYLASLNGYLYGIASQTIPSGATGVWRSADNGTSWTFAGTLPAAYSGRGQLAVTYEGVIYLISNTVMASADGSTWLQLVTGLSLNTDAVLVHNDLIYSLQQANISHSADGITWTLVNAAPSWAAAARINFAAWSLGGNLYVGGGFNTTAGTAYNDVWRSTDNGVTWTQITAAAAWAARHRPAFWTYNDLLWIYGGATTLTSFTAFDNLYSSPDGITWTLVGAAVIGSNGSWYAFTNHNNTMYFGNYFKGTGVGVTLQKELRAAAIVGSITTPDTLTALVPAPSIACEPFSMTLIPAVGATPVRVFLKNSSLAWVYDGTTLVQVTDADYPASTVPGVVYLDATIYVMNSKGIIFGSDLNAPTVWSALNFITANAEADAAVVLARQLNYVVAFKQFSTEFFYDAANAVGSPLGKVLNALLEIGCAQAYSLAFADNTIYFAANSRQKGRSIMKMEGYTPHLISTPYVDRILNADDMDEVYAFVVKTNGHFFYVLTLVTSAITLIYDEASQKWHTWTRMTAASPATVMSAVVQSDGSILITMPLPHGQSDGDVVVIAGATPSAVNGQFNLRYDATSVLQFTYQPDSVVSGSITGSITATFYVESFFPGVYYSYGDGNDLLLDISTGYVYNFSPDIFEDSSQPINLRVRTALLDFGVQKVKRQNRLEIVCDKIDTDVLVRSSDDDYDSASLYRAVDVSQRRPRLHRLGSFNRRAFELRHTGDTQLRLLAIEGDFDLGAF